MTEPFEMTLISFDSFGSEDFATEAVNVTCFFVKSNLKFVIPARVIWSMSMC